MIPGARAVYDRIVAVVAEYPDLSPNIIDWTGHYHHYFAVGRKIPLESETSGFSKIFLGIRGAFYDDDRIDAESFGNGAVAIDFDVQGFKAVAQPYAADSADRAEAILRRALDSIRRAEMPDRLTYWSSDTFDHLVAEKGPDGLYRERVATEADLIPA